MPESRGVKDPERQATFGQTLRTVLWSFFGVRKRSDHERDTARINPVHVVIAGVLATATFVLILILIVRSVVK
jgi:hypothetical protein